MSLRPHLFGFDLAKFRALLGSGDADKAERIQLADAEAQDIARRAVMAGVPFVGLADEGVAHLRAALALATFEQTLDDLGSSTWSMQPLWDLHLLFPELAKLKIFIRGTPLFGARLKAGPYGFLAASDVSQLRAELAPVRRQLLAAANPPPPDLALLPPLKEAASLVSDDEALLAFLARLLEEGLAFNERAIKDLAFAAAKRRGWPNEPAVATTINRFLARFNQAQAKANPKRVLPFLEALEAWLALDRDLLFYAS